MAEMKLLLDERIIGSKEHLNVLGWTAVSVDDAGSRRTGDGVIVRFAKSGDHIAITKEGRMGKKCDLVGVGNFVTSGDCIAKKVDRDLKDELGQMSNR